MPEQKHSFQKDTGGGEGPQGTEEEGAGKAESVVFTPQQASRLLTIAQRESKRKRKLKARRQRRWYHKNAKKRAMENPPPVKHPMSASADVRAVEEAAGLA